MSSSIQIVPLPSPHFWWSCGEVRGWVEREEDINEKLSCHRRSTSLSISYMKTKDRHVSLLQTRTTLLSADWCMTVTSWQATALDMYLKKNMKFSHHRTKEGGGVYCNGQDVFSRLVFFCCFVYLNGSVSSNFIDLNAVTDLLTQN
jgi:hypothetical protein